jgi:hypothetical protein
MLEEELSVVGFERLMNQSPHNLKVTHFETAQIISKHFIGCPENLPRETKSYSEVILY